MRIESEIIRCYETDPGGVRSTKFGLTRRESSKDASLLSTGYPSMGCVVTRRDVETLAAMLVEALADWPEEVGL